MLKPIWNSIGNSVVNAFMGHIEIQRRLDVSLRKTYLEEMKNHHNPLNRCGYKIASQFEEDGIIAELVRRIPDINKTFVEFGVESGVECNSINLLLNKWKGVWVDSRDLCFKPKERQLKYLQSFVTLENIDQLMNDAMGFIDSSELGILSLDLDGNDYHFIEQILKSITPRLLILEYNPAFVPPTPFIMEYDAEHTWNNDSYYGCSLQSWVDLLKPQGYNLVCCSITGSNAFFIRDEDMRHFADIPQGTSKLFQHMNSVWFYKTVHKFSPNMLSRFS